MTVSLGTLTIWSADGQQEFLSSVWTHRTAVVLFVRHFGCLFCRQQVAEMQPIEARLLDLGADLVVVGHGTVEEARAFRDEMGLRCRVFTDPSREVFCALGLPRGVGTLLRPSVAVRAVMALGQGFRQTATAGDALQQGGVVVFERGGRQLFRFVSRAAGEHPAPQEILDVLEKARRPPPGR